MSVSVSVRRNYTLCTLHYEPCTMIYALCTPISALCTLHYALKLALSLCIMDREKYSGKYRKNIYIEAEVDIVQKHHQRSGELTRGYVQRILTKSPEHPHGIKVLLETGEVGRVKWVYEED